jgi:hypothetical protein
MKPKKRRNGKISIITQVAVMLALCIILTGILTYFTQIDNSVRLVTRMTEEKAEMLAKCKLEQVHFAWDRYEDKDMVLPRLKMFRQLWEKRRKWTPNNMIVYTLVNFDTTPEQDLERIYTLRAMGYWAYIMIYDKEHCTDPFYKDLDRWVNNRFIFAKCERIEDYKKTKQTPNDYVLPF